MNAQRKFGVGFRCSPTATRQRGTALLEAALVITILATALFAIIDFSRALYTYHLVANAAREGTRYATVHGSSSGSFGGSEQTQVNTYLQALSSGIGIDTNVLTVTATVSGAPNSNPTFATTCGDASPSPGCLVTVQVQYPFQFALPLLPTGSYLMSSTAAMVVSQ
jgi:Flp pilus assembly protein TadG